jgi:hypothetical protein
MSVERSEFEVRVSTPLELAGAEEGAAELEKAIGKAKALGRSFGRLERRLAKVREGARRFRAAHPWLAERGEEEGGHERRPGREEARVESSEAGSGSSISAMREGDRAGTDDSGTAEDERAGTMPPPGTGAAPEGTAGQEGAGTAAGTEESSTTDQPPSEMDAAAQPAGAWPLEAGAEDGEAGAQAEMSVTGAGVWDAGALGRELEGMVGEALAERGMAEPRREISQEEESRMAALEERLGRLEARASVNRERG